MELYLHSPQYAYDMHMDNFTIMSPQLYMYTLEENSKLKT